MLIAMVLTLDSLFLGAMVRPMTYSASHAIRLWGGSLAGDLEAIRDRYIREWTQVADYLRGQGRPLPVLKDMDVGRIDHHVKILTNVRQPRIASWLFAVVDKLAGLFCGSDAYLKNLDEQWHFIGNAARLSTAAQLWVVVQLLLLIVGAAVSVLAYAVAAA
jgi:hypothetical protein